MFTTHLLTKEGRIKVLAGDNKTIKAFITKKAESSNKGSKSTGN